MADSITQTLQRLNAAAPAALATRARKTRLVGERKPVTAVFADIVGSTTLAEQIDPEDWTLIINAAFDRMSRCIFDFEGTIAQLQGDAIISFFGAPVAHEDDPERAVRAALAMIDSMDEFGQEMKRGNGIDFQIRIGISTGLVLVGNVGSDLRYDYTAIGDTMNLAARLESAAAPGSILIADKTERFVRPFFELDDVGPLELKGKSAGVQAYRVLGERGQPGSVRGLEGLTSPMVGRSSELDTLKELAATAQAGRGRVAIVVAEPGIGKSRLIAELKDAIRGHESRSVDAADAEGKQETAWLTGQSVSYGTQLPFHMVTNLLLNMLGLNQANQPAEVDGALRHLLTELLPDDDEAHAYLLYLMGLRIDAEAGGQAMLPSGEFLAERLAGVVLRLFKQIARQGPLVILLEDLHWADAASADLIEALLTLQDDVPVLIIGTTRDEPESTGWTVVETARQRLGRALTEIRLEPLDRLGSQILVANLLELDSLPRATRDLILDKAEGNPFFVEEVIRMLVEREAIELSDGHWRATGTIEEVPIPDTVHGLVLARIDRLPDDARRVLRLASCIDRQFSVALLEDVARAGEIEGSLGSALGRLEAASLLMLASTEPELEYRFSHALIQDAAYETVLRQERREWHLMVAEALLSRYPEREDELADRLARHFDLAGDASRAIHYLIIAADRASARNAMLDGRALYGRASELLADVDAPADEADRLRVRVTLGQLASGLELMTEDQVWTLLAEGRSAAERSGDVAGLSDLLFWEVMLRQTVSGSAEDSPELRDAMERLAELGEVGGASLQRTQALARSGLFLWWNGEYQGSLAALRKASALFQERGDRIGAAMAESYMAADLASLGSFDEADQRMQASRELAEGADQLARLDYHLAEAALAALRGDYGTSIEYATHCFEGSTEIGALGCATVSGLILGASQMASGDIKQARVSLERSIEFATQGYLAPQRMQSSVLLASVDGMSGDLGKAETGFGSALRALAAIDSPFSEAQTRLARGMVHASHPAGDPEQALEDLDAAVRTFETLGARPSQARALRAQGMALARLDRVEAADDSLRQSANMAAEMGLMDAPWPAGLAEVREMQASQPPIEVVD